MFPLARVPVFLMMFAAAAGGALLMRGHLEPREVQLQNGGTLYAETPASTTPASFLAAVATADSVNVPILVYHIVRPSFPNDSRSVRTIAHTPEVFDAEMKYLADAGYHVIPLPDLERHFKDGATLPNKPVIITFDDGWRDQFEYAFPILQKYHYPATFFVFTNSIGVRGFLSWNNLREMRDAGMNIGSHSLSHPFLTKMTDSAALWNEINGSKEKLEKNLGITVSDFAYPFGQYNSGIEALVKKAGYASARGDYYYGAMQSADRLYELSGLNAPTTTEFFARKFPAH